MNMYDAIYQGVQTSKFSNEELSWDLISEILNYADKLEGLIPDCSVEFKLVNNTIPGEKFHGLFSFYAPYYLLIAAKESADYLVNAGYLMQLMNLYIGTKGLGTHFVYLRAPKHAITASMKYSYIMALAFGKPDVSIYQKPSSDKAHLPEEATVVYKEKVTLPIKKIVNASIMAPSMMRTQPWRLVVYQNRVYIFSKKNVLLDTVLNKSKQLDMGMLLANLFVAADEQWITATLKNSELVKTKPRKSTNYLTTVMLQSSGV